MISLAFLHHSNPDSAKNNFCKALSPVPTGKAGVSAPVVAENQITVARLKSGA